MEPHNIIFMSFDSYASSSKTSLMVASDGFWDMAKQTKKHLKSQISNLIENEYPICRRYRLFHFLVLTSDGACLIEFVTGDDRHLAVALMSLRVPYSALFG